MALRVKKTQLAAVGCMVLFVIVFFFAPVVAYSQNIGLSQNYETGVVNCNGLNETAFEKCLNSYTYPPVTITGYSSLSYRFLGVGDAPFPSRVLVTQGNYSILAFFNGGRVTAAEVVGYTPVTITPNGAVKVQNVSIELLPFGQLNVTIRLDNMGAASINGESQPAPSVLPPLPNVLVEVIFPGDDTNSTYAGVTWMGAKHLGGCPSPWLPGTECGFSFTTTDHLPPNGTFTYYVEVRGSVNGNNFFYREGLAGQAPPSGVTPTWVSQFISQVDASRKGVGLAENTTLDSFAEVRFKTASSQPDISDYGLSSNVASFFGAGGGTNITEVLLYPGSSDPVSYASYLRTYAPEHWSALINANFTQFGFHVGQAPYYQVSVGCPTTEIPSAGVNITKYFESQGCTVTPVSDETWLVIILQK